MNTVPSPASDPQSAFAGLAGEARGLALALVGAGAPAGGAPARMVAKPTAAEVEAWLVHHRDEIIAGNEWPVVAEAWRLASTGQSQGLVDLDRAWGGRGTPGEASLRVGQRQLSRLRPLRDSRVVQRYLDAVESGRAHGWHPIVFGVWLAVFGVPLRQGLVQYAEQILVGLLESVPASPSFPDAGRERIRTEIAAAIPSRLAAFLPASCQPLKALR